MTKGIINNFSTILYVCMLVAVWLYSWIRSVVALLSGATNHALLASSDGVRWFLRTSVDSVGHLPWATIIVLLMCSGVTYSCGFFPTVVRLLHGKTSLRMRRALWSLFVAVAVVAILLLLSALYPLNVYKGISGTFVSSPMASGWPLALFSVLLFLSAVFGVVSGAFKGVDDVVEALSSRIKFHACSLVALVPAALLLSSMEHEGVMTKLFGEYSFYFEWFVVMFPFIYRLLVLARKQATDY